MQFVAHHAIWALPVVFVVSFGESLAFISFAFPGTSVLIAAGALISAGDLQLWPVLAGAVCGAVLGDSISYWLGLRYGHHTEKLWPFTRHPHILPRGHAFFERHGVKSVFIGRFFGPFRAVVPLIAGITRMPMPRFWSANIISALIWAPVLLIPGAAAQYALSRFELAAHWRVVLVIGLMAALAVGLWAARRKGYFTRS
jgi:membrane protein DedA with SNARE-associated domain